MNRMFSLLGGGVLAAGLSVGVYAADDGHKDHKHADEDGKPVTIQGELIDTACFVSSDGDAKGKEHAECATKCMASGVPAGILPKDSKEAHGMLFLLTNPKPLAKHAGKTIKVEGTAKEEMHAFDVKKLYVQAAGGTWEEVKLDDEHHKMGGDGAAHEDGHADHKPADGKAADKAGDAKHDHKK